ncbi:hypothetical protein ISG24_23320 [Burkholderia pseudomallei]|nr:hypothetical protein [Burkholderia pseudomallei]
MRSKDSHDRFLYSKTTFGGYSIHLTFTWFARPILAGFVRVPKVAGCRVTKGTKRRKRRGP